MMPARFSPAGLIALIWGLAAALLFYDYGFGDHSLLYGLIICFVVWGFVLWKVPRMRYWLIRDVRRDQCLKDTGETMVLLKTGLIHGLKRTLTDLRYNKKIRLILTDIPIYFTLILFILIIGAFTLFMRSYYLTVISLCCVITIIIAHYRVRKVQG